ncbi:voltage-gated chloride channel family protein [Flavobacterium soli]|uniref:voltage-gated chloride channel family protein n=1 Tax=Flavobacterium soli TaxID=344881 RepID=UPI000478DFE8|nr:voltage-gated chloride channel family protein [Flavobacterium soli]
MRFKSENSLFYRVFKWLIICLIVGVLAGSSSALFLVSLEFVTNYRIIHPWILFLLPLGGLIIGLMYHYFGKGVAKGNNVILEEYENPTEIIPLKMAPLVLIGTLITHLFGGSAGREGTAVQMSSAIADQFSGIFKLSKSERKTILIIGISAGFASVFGTPLTGAVFAIEVLYFSKINYKSIVPSFIVAYIAYFTVEVWQVSHTHYSIPNVPSLDFISLFWIIFAGILFGLASMLFSKSTRFFTETFSKHIKYPPLRPFIGGIIFVVVIYFTGTTQFLGLGIPTIVNSFEIQQDFSVFILKILFTAFTLGVGFKGGEVTPLFFIGATLGSALSFFVPLPVALLAGMGFVAVFSGATHTPIACTIMGMELFGYECGIYVGIACVVAYFSSGYIGIYESQIIKGPKHHLYQRFNSKKMENL